MKLSGPRHGYARLLAGAMPIYVAGLIFAVVCWRAGAPGMAGAMALLAVLGMVNVLALRSLAAEAPPERWLVWESIFPGQQWRQARPIFPR